MQVGGLEAEAGGGLRNVPSGLGHSGADQLFLRLLDHLVEVFAEGPLSDTLFQVSVGGGHHARATAPVKAPRSRPKSSLSSSVSERVAQLTATNGLPACGLPWWREGNFVTFRFDDFDDVMVGPFSFFSISRGFGTAQVAIGTSFTGPLPGQERVQYHVRLRDADGNVIGGEDPVIEPLGSPPQ